MGKLANKTALITGGNSGIGLASAKLFIEEGAKVIITGRNAQAVHDAAASLGHGTTGIVNDAADITAVKGLHAQLTEHGVTSLDILFYNAGVGFYMPVADMTEEVFDANMNINFKGAFFTVQQILPLLNDGGSIIFNASVLATVSMPGNGPYGASKASLVNLAKTLALELAPKRVRTNTLSPGPTETSIMSKAGFPDEDLKNFVESLIQRLPLGRFAQADEMAKAALFLASDDSSFITGADLIVDGGFSIQ